MVLLEYFGMMAARTAGLPVPEVHLGADHKHLLVKRFDVTSDGNHLAFEDMCALLALPAREKFTGSVERVVKTIATFCRGEQRHKSLDQCFGQYLLASTIRNGDAHLKNFGLLYEDVASSRLAPVYDMLSMSVYAPLRANSREADDDMAMSFEGNKDWLSLSAIESLSRLCSLTTKRANQWKAQIAAALIETADKVMHHVHEHPDDGFAPSAKRMLELWAIGLETVDRAAAQRVRDTAGIAKANAHQLKP
jgi:serine/threonine-protein kinase HipA